MLRITAGAHRGRKLQVPKVAATRPLVERAREGVFSHIRELVPGSTVWDVYAGSGILGLEALSRGAARVVAVERNRLAAAQLLENARMLDCEDRMQVLRIDAHRMAGMSELEPPSLIFFDPPYADFRGGGPQRIKVWGLFIALAERLSPAGVAIVHTPRGILHQAELECLPGIEQRDYGSTSLYWWHRPA